METRAEKEMKKGEKVEDMANEEEKSKETLYYK